MNMRQSFVVFFLVSVTGSGWAGDNDAILLPDQPTPETWLSLDEAGWTIVRPAADSRLIYVSSSEGNDGVKCGKGFR